MSRKASIILLLLAVSPAFAQIHPSTPGGDGGRMGYSSGAGIARPSGSPGAQPTYTPPTSTPGSSVGYVPPPVYNPNQTFQPSGSGSSSAYRPSYAAPAPGGINPYGSAYSSAGTFSAPPTGAPGGGTIPPPISTAPGTTGTTATFGGPAISSGPPVQAGSLFSGPSMGINTGVGPGGFSNPTTAPAAVQASAAKPAATAPAAAPVVITEPTDEAYKSALKRFNEGHYSETLSLLSESNKSGEAPLPTRKLYISALVADGQLSMAAYEALDAAKSNPLTFLTEPTLATTYKGNPELALHIKAVTDFTRGSTTTIGNGVLLAMFTQLSPKAKDPVEVLADVNVTDADKKWFGQLKGSIKPRN